MLLLFIFGRIDQLVDRSDKPDLLPHLGLHPSDYSDLLPIIKYIPVYLIFHQRIFLFA
jgi:hypothetical protein